MSPRVYVRKFDYDEARARHEAGESIAALAREYGVSQTRVDQVVHPERGERDRLAALEFQRNGVCPDCGGRASRNRTVGQHRCRACAAKAAATTVAEHMLRCQMCKEWKPDEAFHHNAHEAHRRGRHSQCRACSTKQRRDYRNRQKVPCVGCGRPALPPNEKGTRGSDVPRCHACAMKAARRNPSGQFART